jgi:hypothetical protein
MKKQPASRPLRAVPSAGAAFREAVAELFEDPSPLDAMLVEQAAELLDRIEQARGEIAAHGVCYRAGKLLRTNPAVQVERDSVRCLLAVLRALRPEGELSARDLEDPMALAARVRR